MVILRIGMVGSRAELPSSLAALRGLETEDADGRRCALGSPQLTAAARRLFRRSLQPSALAKAAAV
jgi:hypothetical protein